MSGISMKVELTGVADVFARMEGLKDGVQRKVLRKAVNAAGTPIVKAVRAGAPKELKKTIKKKVKAYRQSGKVIVIIGPESGVKVLVDLKPDRVYRVINGQVVHIRKALPEQLKVERNAARRAKAIEFGTKNDPPAPFIRPGFESAKQAAADAFAAKAGEEFAKL